MSGSIKAITMYETTDGSQFKSSGEAWEHQRGLNRPAWVFAVDSKEDCRTNIEDAMVLLQASFSWTDTPEGRVYWAEHQRVLCRMIKELEE